MLRRSWLLLPILASALACGDEDASTNRAGDGAQNGAAASELGPDDETTAATQAEAFAEPAAAAGCTTTVGIAKELMVTNLAVVEDPARTGADGAWSFGKLMTNMAGDGDPQAFVRRWLATWEADQTINGFTVPARSAAIRAQVIDPWPKDPAGKLDLAKSPMRLLAIVNRLDLRDLSKGNAGEGRFVFGVTRDGNPLSFTVILEYKLVAKTANELKAWASLWHSLGALPLGSAAYNAKLQEITDKFAGKNADPTRPNGSSIGQVRTNEIALAIPWELREFHVSATTGLLGETTIAKTPSSTLLNSRRTGRFINAREAKILDGSFSVPLTFEELPFRGSNAPTDLTTIWNPPNATNRNARHLFSVNTCNGCHGGETRTTFLHVAPRSAGQVAGLSGFLTGSDVADPISGKVRRFDDLARRKKDMQNLLCATPADAAVQPVNTRVH